MTVPSSTAKSGPYLCNGVTDVFNYGFRIVDKAHLNVILADADGAETTLDLTTHYTVSDVGEDTGSINLTSTGLALAVSGTTLTILRNPPFTQETDLQNQGAYLAQTVEDRFDLAVMQIQTVKEKVDRAIVIQASDDSTTGEELSADVARLAASADSIDTVAENVTAVNTTAANIAEVIDAPNQAADAAASADAAATSETNAAASATAADTDADRAEAAAESIDYLSVADIAALKAVDTTKHTAALIKATDIAGQFIWNSSDLSSEVAADEYEATYVAPTSDATGASGAWVRRRGSANHSVLEYGADRTGASSAADRFSAAVKLAPAAVTSQYSYAAMPLPETVIVDVPNGTYQIDDYVDVHGRDVVWNLADSAVILDGDGNRHAIYLQGRIVRRNRLSLSAPSGILDTACGHSIHVGYGSYDQSAQIIGFTDPAKVGMNDTLDLCGEQIDVVSPPPLHQSAATAFTATGATLATPVDVRRLVKGMFVETTNTPPERGQITDWASDGSEITVTGWYPVTPGTQTAGVTPSTAYGILFNPISKIWGMNWIVALHADGFAREAAGVELDIENNVASPVDAESKDGQTWGFDIANTGTYNGSSAFIARGSFFEGFRAAGPTSAFVAKANEFYAAPGLGLNFVGDGVALLAQNAAGHRTVQMENAALSLGDQEAANTYIINARTSGDNTRDYDSRIVFTGGSAGSNGTGEIDLYAAVIRTQPLQPLLDNTYALGAGSLRWSEIFAATGTINTSDASLKSLRGDGQFTDAEMRAVGRVMEKGPVVFQWNDAVEEKGDGARLHTGFLAQDWIEAFEAEGLDWRRYAAFCEDEVFEMVEVTEERQVPVMEAYEAEETVPVEGEDDRYVQRTRTVVKQRPKTEQRPLYAEDGSVVTRQRKAKDAEGRIVGYRTVPVSVTHTFMTTQTDRRMEKRATGEKRLGLRYDQVWAMIFAWMAWNRSIVVKGVREE